MSQLTTDLIEALDRRSHPRYPTTWKSIRDYVGIMLAYFSLIALLFFTK